MKDKMMFPNWFKNILYFIAIWDLLKEFSKPAEISSNFIIVLSFPIILFILLFVTKKRNLNISSEKYFFNISIAFVCFFTLVFILNYREYIEFIGHKLGSNFSIVTDYSKTEYDDQGNPYAPDKVISMGNESYYSWAYIIYFTLISYFCLSSWYLFNKIKKITVSQIEAENQRHRQKSAT